MQSEKLADMLLEQKLIEKVQTFKCLYDAQDEGFNDSPKKLAAWSQIGKQLNMDASEVKRSWRNLKDYYLSIKRFEGSTPTANKKIKWAHYARLQFLDDCLKRKVVHGMNKKPADDVNILLIKSIQRFKLLYDIYDSDYKNNRKRKEAWTEITKDLNMKEQFIKDKWKELKTSFFAINERETDCANDSFITSEPAYKYMQNLEFLLEHSTEERSIKAKHTDTDLEQNLIDEVKRYPELYNTRDPFYNNRRHVSLAWTKIARTLNVNVIDVKRRWRGLRDYYYSILRQKKLFELCGGKKPVHWKYYKSMQFLKEYMQSKSNLPELFAEKLQDKKCTNVEKEQAESYHSEESDFAGPLNVKYEENSIEMLYEHEEDQKNMSRDQSMDANAEFLEEQPAPPEANNSMEAQTLNPIFFSDSFSLYFLGLAQDIKDSNLPRNKLVSLKRKISNLVYDELEQFSAK